MLQAQSKQVSECQKNQQRSNVLSCMLRKGAKVLHVHCKCDGFVVVMSMWVLILASSVCAGHPHQPAYCHIAVMLSMKSLPKPLMEPTISRLHEATGYAAESPLFLPHVVLDGACSSNGLGQSHCAEAHTSQPCLIRLTR